MPGYARACKVYESETRTALELKWTIVQVPRGVRFWQKRSKCPPPSLNEALIVSVSSKETLTL